MLYEVITRIREEIVGETGGGEQTFADARAMAVAREAEHRRAELSALRPEVV